MMKPRRKLTAAERREQSYRSKINARDRTIIKLTERIRQLEATIHEFYAGPIYKRRYRLGLIREYHRYGGLAKGRELTKMTDTEIAIAIRALFRPGVLIG